MILVPYSGCFTPSESLVLNIQNALEELGNVHEFSKCNEMQRFERDVTENLRLNIPSPVSLTTSTKSHRVHKLARIHTLLVPHPFHHGNISSSNAQLRRCHLAFQGASSCRKVATLGLCRDFWDLLNDKRLYVLGRERRRKET